jgi:hypothetical protein
MKHLLFGSGYLDIFRRLTVSQSRVPSIRGSKPRQDYSEHREQKWPTVGYASSNSSVAARAWGATDWYTRIASAMPQRCPGCRSGLELRSAERSPENAWIATGSAEARNSELTRLSVVHFD